MSLWQKVVVTLLPQPWAEKVKAESRNWLVSCTCGYERTFWDAGGVRFVAEGTEQRYLYCPYCDRRRWHALYKLHKVRKRAMI